MLAQIQLKLMEIEISQVSRLRGRSVGEVQIWGKGLFLVVALRYANGETRSHPPASQVLHKGDTLMVVGHIEDLVNFAHY